MVWDVWAEGELLAVVQGKSAVVGVVRHLGMVPVLEYNVGPMSGFLLLESLGPEVSVKILDGCGHLAGDEGVVHCQACTCSWCQSLAEVTGNHYYRLDDADADDHSHGHWDRNGVPDDTDREIR
jgi:hypothetical protein